MEFFNYFFSLDVFEVQFLVLISLLYIQNKFEQNHKAINSANVAMLFSTISIIDTKIGK